ncbi:PilN domain-containing protein [Xenorhabdus hominickii]|nr:PilN domain-containing protein [Xenorhabdus hominickii]PHM57813.1 type IV pili biogenesis protein PilN [Xenorhabdus hominickii]
MYQVNFLPWRQKKLRHKFHKWTLLLGLQTILWAATLVFISMQQITQIGQYRRQLTEFDHQFTQLQQSIRDTSQAVQHHHQLTEQLRKKQVVMEQNQRYLQLFRQLPRLLPEKSWLTAFSDDSGQLVFNARSQNYEDISDLLNNLTNGNSLIDVQLKKMTTTEDHLKAFTIDANWLMGGSSEQ